MGDLGAMTDKAKSPAHSGLLERFTLLLLLVAAGTRSDALFRDLPSSATSVVYLACLVLMAVTTLRALGGAWESRSREDPNLSLAPGWHVHRTFTDPLFQLPAVFGVVLLLVDFVLELVAEPPESEVAVWFLTGMAALMFAATCAIIWRARPSNEPGGADSPSNAREQSDTEQQKANAFQDPWFAVPGVVAPLLVIVRPLLEEIEEGNFLGSITPYMVGLLVGGGAVAIVAIQRRRDPKNASAESERLSVGKTGEDE